MLQTRQSKPSAESRAGLIESNATSNESARTSWTHVGPAQQIYLSYDTTCPTRYVGPTGFTTGRIGTRYGMTYARFRVHHGEHYGRCGNAPCYRRNWFKKGFMGYHRSVANNFVRLCFPDHPMDRHYSRLLATDSNGEVLATDNHSVENDWTKKFSPKFTPTRVGVGGRAPNLWVGYIWKPIPSGYGLSCQSTTVGKLGPFKVCAYAVSGSTWTLECGRLEHAWLCYTNGAPSNLLQTDTDLANEAQDEPEIGADEAEQENEIVYEEEEPMEDDDDADIQAEKDDHPAGEQFDIPPDILENDPDDPGHPPPFVFDSDLEPSLSQLNTTTQMWKYNWIGLIWGVGCQPGAYKDVNGGVRQYRDFWRGHFAKSMLWKWGCAWKLTSDGRKWQWKCRLNDFATLCYSDFWLHSHRRDTDW